MNRITGLRWVIVGYCTAIVSILAGALIIYSASTGFFISTKAGMLETISIGLLVLLMAPAATSFFTGYSKLGQDILLAELPTRTFLVVERFPQREFVRVKEIEQEGRTYNVRMSSAMMEELPNEFRHIGKAEISIQHLESQ